MGYDPEIIPGCNIQLPVLSEAVRAVALEQGEPVDHTRFSIIFNQTRKFAHVTAHNIDGATKFSKPREGNFKFDPDIDNAIQIDNDQGYRGVPAEDDNPWDRGHLVRRASLIWGDPDEAKIAERESFFWSNVCPQHSELHDGPWADIEDWMLDLADDGDKRACVFTGPVLTSSDPEIINFEGQDPFLLPAGFWKIMAIKHGGALRVAAFLVWQMDFDRPVPLTFEPFLEQVRITTIEFLIGVSFASLRDADPLQFGAVFDEREGRRRVRVDSARTRPAAITCPGDIML